MAANGRVIVNFSKPYVGLYNNPGGVGTYTKGMVLARGVSVDLNVETADDNHFYADGVIAESNSSVFSAGSLDLGVDGLNPNAEQFVMGLPEPEQVEAGGKTVSITRSNATINAPYVGLGVIIEYVSGGEHIFVPVIFPKVRFREPGLSARTREDSVDYQSQSLTADLHRDDTSNHDWKWVCADCATEGEAEGILKAMLGVAS